jgi:hypothetical protein
MRPRHLACVRRLPIALNFPTINIFYQKVDWQDNARDISNFLLHFLPKHTTEGTLPTHLARLSPAETERRINSGFSDRKLVAIGHSYGGCTSSVTHSLYRLSLFLGLLPHTALLRRLFTLHCSRLLFWSTRLLLGPMTVNNSESIIHQTLRLAP